MAIDLSDASRCIPAGTIAIVHMHVKPPGDMAGADGVLKRTKNGDAEGLDAEFTVLEGPYAKQKFYSFMMLVGTTDGQRSMCESTKVKLKAIVDSARFLDPNDKSPETRAKRTVEWRDFDGVRFLCEIGIEPARGGFDERNSIAKVITRDMPQWSGRPPIEQSSGPDPSLGGAPSNGGTAPTPAPAPIVKAVWAQ